MQFTTNIKDFVKVLSTAIKAVPAKAAFPMMENFLITVDDGVHVKATDGSITIESHTEAQGQGEACINAKLLLDAVSLLPDGDLTITTEDTTCTIKYNKGQFTLPCFPTEDFPNTPYPLAEDVTAIPCGELKSALKYVLPSVATDQLRPAMCGVFFNPTDTGLDLVASDSHSLSLQKVGCFVKTKAFILPSSAAKFLVGQLPDTEDDVTIATNDSAASFTFGATQMDVVTIVGKFPNYNQVIPTNNGNTLTAKVADLLATVKRVATCANKASQVIKVTLSTLGGATIEAQDVGFGCSAKEDMDCVTYNGADITIGFKHELLSNLLGALGEEEVKIDMDSPRKAVLISTDDESRKAILMPVAVTENTK